MRFPKLKIAYFNGKNPSNFSWAKFHSKYHGRLWVKSTRHDVLWSVTSDNLPDFLLFLDVPKITKKLEDVTLDEGAELTLQIEANAVPIPDVTWWVVFLAESVNTAALWQEWLV